MKLVMLLDLSTGSLYSPRDISGTHISQNLGEPQERSGAGRIQSVKNRTCDLLAFSALPQPTAPSRTPLSEGVKRPC